MAGPGACSASLREHGETCTGARADTVMAARTLLGASGGRLLAALEDHSLDLLASSRPRRTLRREASDSGALSWQAWLRSDVKREKAVAAVGTTLVGSLRATRTEGSSAPCVQKRGWTRGGAADAP